MFLLVIIIEDMVKVVYCSLKKQKDQDNNENNDKCKSSSRQTLTARNIGSQRHHQHHEHHQHHDHQHHCCEQTELAKSLLDCLRLKQEMKVTLELLTNLIGSLVRDLYPTTGQPPNVCNPPRTTPSVETRQAACQLLCNLCENPYITFCNDSNNLPVKYFIYLKPVCNKKSSLRPPDCDLMRKTIVATELVGVGDDMSQTSSSIFKLKEVDTKIFQDKLECDKTVTYLEAIHNLCNFIHLAIEVSERVCHLPEKIIINNDCQPVCLPQPSCKPGVATSHDN